VGCGKTKLIAASPYEMTLVMTRTRDKVVPFEPEGAVDGNGGEARLLEDRTSKLGKGQEEETFALGVRVTNVADELVMLEFPLGRLKPVETLPAKDDPELGICVSRGRVAVKLGDTNAEVEGSVSDAYELLSKPLVKLEISSEVIGKVFDVAEASMGDEELLNGNSPDGEMLRLDDDDQVGGSRLAVNASVEPDMEISTETDVEVDEMALSDGVRLGDCSVDMSETLRVLGSAEGLSNEIVNSLLRVEVIKGTFVVLFDKKELQNSEGAVVGCAFTSESVTIVGLVELIVRKVLDVSSTVEGNGLFTVIEVLMKAVVEPLGKVDVDVKRMFDVSNTSVPVGNSDTKEDDAVGSISLTEFIELLDGIRVIVLSECKDGSGSKVGTILGENREETPEMVGKKIEADPIGPLESSGAMDVFVPKLNKTDDDIADVNNVDARLESALLITLVDRG